MHSEWLLEWASSVALLPLSSAVTLRQCHFDVKRHFRRKGTQQDKQATAGCEAAGGTADLCHAVVGMRGHLAGQGRRCLR